MDTAEGQLSWITKFASVDLRRLTSGDSQQVRRALAEFVAGPEQSIDGSMAVRPTEHPVDVSAESLAALQAEIRVLLVQLVDAREQGGVAPTIQLTAAPRLALLSVGELLGMPDRTGLLVTELPLRDAVLWMLVELLSRMSTRRLQRCPETRCGRRVFFRVRRQKFCSPRCMTRATKRTYRKTNKGYLKEKGRKRRAARLRKGRTPR
jgi:hypothetical protein